jgi:hypothetical protein
MFASEFLIATVVLTVCVGVFYDKSTPYFPIEISRTATGPTSRWIFSIGLSCSILMLLLENPSPQKYALLCIGLLLLAWVDDVTSRFWHMMGVIILFIGSVSIVNWKVVWVPLLCGAGIYATRIIMKGLAVTFLEKTTEGIFDWRGAANESIRIMYTGEVKEQLTLRIFEATGVMQWILLWLLYHIVMNK